MFQNKGKGGQNTGSGNGVTDEQIDQLFHEIDRTKLSEWEQKFLQSTQDFWKRNRKLSDKQRNRLAEIGEKQRESGGPKTAS